MPAYDASQEIRDLFEPSVEAYEEERRRRLERLDTTSRKPAGYVHKNVPGTIEQHELLKHWTRHVPEAKQEATRRFLVHLLASTRAAWQQDDRPAYARGFVPIGSKFIELHFRDADWETLEKGRLLEVLRYDRFKGLSREFKVSLEGWEAFLEAGLGGSGGAFGRRVLLASGKSTKKRIKSVKGKRPPQLVADAMDAVGPSPFNLESIRSHLASLRRLVVEVSSRDERRTALLRFCNDAACLEGVHQQGSRPLHGPLWEYQPAYRMQSTGRLGQEGGGLQSCSREMKEAAYADVPGVVNLDLSGSQARILIVLMQEAGIEPTWLLRYVGEPEAKHKAADYVGVSVDTWKSCLYAALMGARVPGQGSIYYSQGSLRTDILKEVGQDRFDEAYARFLALTADLLGDLDTWHDYLAHDFIEQHGRYVGAHEKTFIKNEVGASVAVEDLDEKGKPYKLKARLAAFFLQGREAAFTHALVASSAQYGFRVISHEHDGVVAIGSVPEAAVQAAAEKARLPLRHVRLVPKPFV